LKPSPALVKLVQNGKILPGKTLDIGCGLGIQSIYLAQEGFRVTGIDISETAIKKAKQRAKRRRARVKFTLGNSFELRFPSASFDFALDRGCFHHVPIQMRDTYIRGIHRVLRHKGKYMLMAFSKRNKWGVQNEFSFQDIKMYFGNMFRILSAEEVEHMQPDGWKVYMHSILMERLEMIDRSAICPPLDK
jgi:ubiquinone/menaquinone biosynthesis C-methylase UbiE